MAVGHDARAAGVAEAVAGAARGLDNFLLLPLGTGIAAAVVVHGEPVPGATVLGRRGRSHAGLPRWGAVQLRATGMPGGVRLRRRAGPPLCPTRRNPGRGQPGDRRRANHRSGGPHAVWDDATQALGTALATLTLTLDPARIVLGGGLADAGALFFDPVRDALRAALAWRPPPPVLRSAFGAQAAQVGAAIMARRVAGLPVPDGWGAPESPRGGAATVAPHGVGPSGALSRTTT